MKSRPKLREMVAGDRSAHTPAVAAKGPRLRHWIVGISANPWRSALLVTFASIMCSTCMPAFALAQSLQSRLADRLTISALTILPENVQDDEPFVITATLTNIGAVAADDLRWYPGIEIDRAQPTDHPPIQVLHRVPARLTLAPGEHAQVTIAIKVTQPGTRRYGLLVEEGAGAGGPVSLFDPMPHTTLPGSPWFRLRGPIAAAAVILAALASLVVSIRSSERVRTIVRGIVWDRLTMGGLLRISLIIVLLVATLNLARVVQLSVAAGVSSSLFAWAPFVYLPALLLGPLVFGVFLARTKLPALYLLVIPVAAFTQLRFAAFNQVPLATWLSLWAPGLAAGTLAVGVRLMARLKRVGTAVALVGMGVYVVLATPWVRVYVEQVAIPLVRR